MLFRTRSILQLTILGFLLVAALLISALVISAQQLDTLTQLQALGNDSAIAEQAEHLRGIEVQAYDELNAATSETGFEYPRLAYDLTRLTSAVAPTNAKSKSAAPVTCNCWALA